MKNGRTIMLLVCALSLTLVIGIFIGRNLRTEYVKLPQNDKIKAISATEVPKDYRLDVNTATKLQLMELPGVGEMIADRIISYRTENGPYTSVDDLLNVEGVGEKKLRQLETLIKVGG